MTYLPTNTPTYNCGINIVWDNHACMPLRPEDSRFLPHLYKVRNAGINIISLNLAFGDQNGAAAVAMASSIGTWIEAHSDDFMLVRSVDDVLHARNAGRLGICFDLEGMDVLGGEITNVARFYELGVRWMLAAYNQANSVGGGCLEPDDGLTTFGRSVVAEMNRVGMAVCASHCGHRTARELIDCSATPVIFSHSNPSACWDHPRNIPDDLMLACANRGGVIGINGFGPFLGVNDASSKTYVSHVEYALDLVGDDHVGIALDYAFDKDELDAYVAGDPDRFPPHLYTCGAQMIAPWRIPEIAQMLRSRGHSETTMRKLLGENHLRIASQVWL